MYRRGRQTFPQRPNSLMKNSRRIRNFNSRNGFMLMELVVVVMVLGILAAAAAGRATDVASQAASSTLKTNLTIIADAIERETQFSGSIPASIDPKWFQNRRLPTHPQNSVRNTSGASRFSQCSRASSKQGPQRFDAGGLLVQPAERNRSGARNRSRKLGGDTATL